MGSETAASDERVRFTRSLARLRDEGCAILVVGEPPESVRATACARLSGDDDIPHERVFVRTDDAAVTEPIDTDGTEIRYRPLTRDSAATVSDAGSEGFPATTLAELTERLSREATRATATIDRFDEAGLRVCFDSLPELRAQYTEQELFQFLHGAIAEIKAVDGMGHFHLPLPVDDAFVATLRPLFDAVVDLRAGESGPGQRWWLAETETWTEWFSL